MVRFFSIVALVWIALAPPAPVAWAGSIAGRDVGDGTIAVVVRLATDTGSANAAIQSTVARLFEAALQDAGGRVLDREALKQLRSDETLTAKLGNPTLSDLLEIKNRYSTDVVVSVDVQFEVTPGLAGRWWVGVAEVSASVYLTDSADQIGSAASDPMGGLGSPSAVGEGELAARGRALRQATNDVLEKLGLPMTPAPAWDGSIIARSAWSHDLDVDILDLALSSDASKIAVLTSENGIHEYHLEDGREAGRNALEIKKSGSIQYRADGGLVVVGGSGQIYLCESAACSVLGKAPKNVVDADLSPDGQMLAVLTSNGQVQVWDTHADSREAHLSWSTGKKRSVNVAYLPDARSILTSTERGELGFWDPNRGGNRLRSFETAEVIEELDASALSSAGDVMALSITRKEKDKFSQGGGAAGASAIREGLGSVNYSYPIRLLQVQTGQTFQQIEDGHGKRGTALSFGPSSRFLVSGGLDGTVKIWDTERAREMASVSLSAERTGDRVFVLVSPDIKHIVAATQAGRLEAWRIE
jgi:hypothetical protein